MSNQGPRLLCSKQGYAFAKFNGRKINFGRFDDASTRIRFDAFKAQWLLNGRELTSDMLPARAGSADALTVDQLAEMFLSHLRLPTSSVASAARIVGCHMPDPEGYEEVSDDDGGVALHGSMSQTGLKGPHQFGEAGPPRVRRTGATVVRPSGATPVRPTGAM